MYNSSLYMFADDSKIFKYIKESKDYDLLKACCQGLYDWSEKWLMKINVNKCKVLTLSTNKNFVDYKYGFQINQSDSVELERVSNMKDLGVTIDSELSFKDHIYDKI